MRLSALLLLLVPLCCCEKQNITVHITVQQTYQTYQVMDVPTGLCLDGDDKTEKRKLYDALNGECCEYKTNVNLCCKRRADCMKKNKGRVYCGVEQAECIQEMNFKNPFCQARTNYLVKRGLTREDGSSKLFVGAQKYGVSQELYGNCTVASVKIDKCRGAFMNCLSAHKKRKEIAVREPYECSDQGRICLEQVRDIDRSYQCAREVGYAWTVMGERWKAKVDGTEDEEDSSTEPFTVVIHQMQRRWGFSWWAALAVILAVAVGSTLLCCSLCYCCAMAGVKRQKQQRRWERSQKRRERGIDRYSTAESVQPSSVRVSRYEESTE